MTMLNGIQGRLLVFFLVLDLTALGVMVFTVSRDARGALEAQIKNQIGITCEDVAKELRDDLVIKWQNLKQLSTNPFIVNNVSQNYGGNQHLKTFMHGLVLPGKGSDKCMVWIIDSKGRELASNAAAVNNDTDWPGNSLYLSGVLQNREPYTQFIYNNGDPAIFFVFPILNRQHPEGILVGRVDFSFVHEITSFYKEFQTAILNRSGQVLFGTLPKEVIDRHKNPGLFAGGDMQYAMLPVKKSPYFGDLGWNLYLSVPASRVLAPVNDMRRRMVWVGLVVAVFLAVIVLWRSRYFVRPLKNLQETMIAIMEKGDLTKRVEISSSDEIGSLAVTFNNMVENLLQRNQELERSGERLAMLARITHTSPYPILMTDDMGLLKVWNEAADKLFGWTAGEVLGHSVFEVLVPEEGLDTAKRLTAQADKGEIVHAELYRKTKDGLLIPVEITLSVISNPEGRILGRLAIFRDLREVVKLRQQLLQSEKMSAVGQLAAGISHELNNPICVILTFAQSVLRRLKEQDVMIGPLKSIEREAVRCKDLVRNLLLFSRSAVTEQKEEININETLSETLPIVSARCKVANVEIQQIFDKDLPKVSANKNQMQQVLINLCNNAIDAMPSGGKLIICTAKTCRNGCDCIILEVSDNGTGIPKEIQTRVFDPFFTTKEVGKGTGLGLSLVYEIVQKHQGRIDLESELGKGSIFKICLPVANRTLQQQGVLVKTY